jgi:3-oxoacyl-[acyl-carrier-protein] synthase-3
MINIQRYGNTTAATILYVCVGMEKQLKKGDNINPRSFGGGFTWGATWVKWSYDS